MLLSNLNFFVVTLFLLNFLFTNAFISLDFTYINKKTGKSTPNDSSTAEYFSSLIYNPIYTTLNINNKEIKFHITMDRYSTYISEKNLKNIDPKAADEKNEKGNLCSLNYIGIPIALYTNSSFSFKVNNSKSINSKLSFFMPKQMINDSKEIEKYCYARETEEIGLNIKKGNKLFKVAVEYDPDDDYRDYDDDYYDYDHDFDDDDKIYKNDGFYIEENTNLITQLKEQKIISSYAFFIKYNKKSENGKIIIGWLSHECDSDNYKEKYFIYDTISLEQDLPVWQKKIDNIKYGEQILNGSKTIEFSLDSGFIVTSTYNKKILDEIFFENPKFAKYCKEEIIEEHYVKSCDKKIIKEFQPIKFCFTTVYNDNINIIEFDYNDLFIKSESNKDIYYFQIVFKGGYYNWLLGRPLFKKYPMIFDQNKKIFGFYSKTGEEKDKGESNKAWIIVIILIIILICIIIFGIVFYIRNISNKRKQKANELIDDNYDYEPASENNKKTDIIN